MRQSFLLFFLVGTSASGTEQPLSFTVTGPTLNVKAQELVVSTTSRFGRAEEFTRFESLLGFGYGLTPTLQAQVLISIALESVGSESRSAEGAGQTRWFWHPLDSRRDLLGLNVLGALGVGRNFVFLEARLGAEKWVGEFLFALNLGVDYRIQSEPQGPQLHVQPSGGIVYRLANNFTSGFEIRSRFGFERGEYFGGAIFAGPVFGWRHQTGWFSLAALPQVAAIKAKSQVGNGEPLELRDNERVVLRLLLGFDL